MNRPLLLILSIVTACIGLQPVSVRADVITFNSIPNSGSGFPIYEVPPGLLVPGGTTPPVLTTQGFVFGSTHFHTFGDGSAGTVTNGTTFIGQFDALSDVGPIFMAHSSFFPFSLLGFDGAEALLAFDPAFPNNTAISVFGLRTDLSIVGVSVPLDGAPGFETFALDQTLFSNLLVVSFQGTGPDSNSGEPASVFALDNIRVVVLPEPVSLLAWSLLGLAVLDRMRRRRRHAAP